MKNRSKSGFVGKSSVQISNNRRPKPELKIKTRIKYF